VCKIKGGLITQSYQRMSNATEISIGIACQAILFSKTSILLKTLFDKKNLLNHSN